MKRLLIALPILVSLSFQTQAAIIGFAPSDQSVGLGDNVSVDLYISGLGDDILTGFDIDVSFDDSILGFESFTYGTGLDTFGLGTLNDTIDWGFGAVNVFELSFDFDEDLQAFQPNDFVLGTFTFSTLSEGISFLDADVLGLSGEYVFDDILGFEVAKSLSADVVSGSVTVPEPAILSLLIIGLMGIGISRHISKTQGLSASGF